MKLKSILYSFIWTVSACSASTSFSSIISQDIELTVSYTESSGFSVGDKLSISFSYDDESTRLNWFNDGANGIGEFGDGDDFIDETWCLQTDPEAGGGACGFGVFSSSDYSFFSDASTFDIDSLTNNIAGSERGNSLALFSTAHVRGVRSLNTVQVTYQKDDISFKLNTFGSATLRTYSNTQKTYYETRFSLPSQFVSEPEILVILVSGLSLLAFYRKPNYVK